MAFHVRDEATDIAVRKLTKLKGKSLTAIANEYQRECHEVPLSERLEAPREWSMRAPIPAAYRRTKLAGGCVCRHTAPPRADALGPYKEKGEFEARMKL
jgi:hypothetical protein